MKLRFYVALYQLWLKSQEKLGCGTDICLHRGKLEWELKKNNERTIDDRFITINKLYSVPPLLPVPLFSISSKYTMHENGWQNGQIKEQDWSPNQSDGNANVLRGGDGGAVGGRRGRKIKYSITSNAG